MPTEKTSNGTMLQRQLNQAGNWQFWKLSNQDWIAAKQNKSLLHQKEHFRLASRELEAEKVREGRIIWQCGPRFNYNSTLVEEGPPPTETLMKDIQCILANIPFREFQWVQAIYNEYQRQPGQRRATRQPEWEGFRGTRHPWIQVNVARPIRGYANVPRRKWIPSHGEYPEYYPSDWAANRVWGTHSVQNNQEWRTPNWRTPSLRVVREFSWPRQQEEKWNHQRNHSRRQTQTVYTEDRNARTEVSWRATKNRKWVRTQTTKEEDDGQHSQPEIPMQEKVSRQASEGTQKSAAEQIRSIVRETNKVLHGPKKTRASPPERQQWWRQREEEIPRTTWAQHRKLNEQALQYAKYHNATILRLQRCVERKGLKWMNRPEDLDYEGVIYAITQTGSRHLYIGQSINSSYSRFKQHFWKRTLRQTPLQQSMARSWDVRREFFVIPIQKVPVAEWGSIRPRERQIEKFSKGSQHT